MGAWELKHQAVLAGWAERVRECRSSGISVSEWCEEQGIERRAYYRWEREVLKAAGESKGVAAQTEFVQLAPKATEGKRRSKDMRPSGAGSSRSLSWGGYRDGRSIMQGIGVC